MATETFDAGLGEIRQASASKGLSCTTAAATVGLPKGTQFVMLEGRNYSTAVVVGVALNPYLIVLKTVDLLATVTDYSEAAQDNDANTDVVLSSLDTLANGDALWVGSHVPFRGLSVDVDATNGTASVLSGTYWNGSALTNISLSDGTANAGATFGQDGAITWTVPTDWVKAPLTTLGSPGAAVPASGNALYWVRLVVSAALDSSTTLNSLHALNRSTAYYELTSGRVFERRIKRGPGGTGSVEALTDAGTANLLINVATLAGAVFG